MTTTKLVSDDGQYQTFDVFDDNGNKIGQNVSPSPDAPAHSWIVDDTSDRLAALEAVVNQLVDATPNVEAARLGVDAS